MSSHTISLIDAIQLHFIHGSDPALLFHCSHVTNIAQQIIDQLSSTCDIDKNLVLIGAFLHDIGRNKTQGIKHGLESSRIIRASFPQSEFVDSVANITARHIGGGIPKIEAKMLGLPEIDFLPITIEEKIVCYADKMVDYEFDKTKGIYKIIKWFTFNSVDNEAKKLSSHLGPDHPAIKRLYGLEKELTSHIKGKKFTFTTFSG